METLAEMDFAFIVLWLFLLFFAGLILYLRREDRREGYPLEEEDNANRLLPTGSFLFFAQPKEFALPHGHGLVTAPNNKRDTRVIAARRLARSAGSPSEPTGNPLVDGVGPAAWAERSNVADLANDGTPKIVPMRAAPGFSIVAQDSDPRGMKVEGTDYGVAGVVTDVWVDKPEALIRYLEVKLNSGRTVLLPMTMALVNGTRGVVSVDAITAAQFEHVPGLAQPDQVTLYEEERIVAYYGGGYLYATPDRSEPLL
jgi:photosynthetic reaction center H subunit